MNEKAVRLKRSTISGRKGVYINFQQMATKSVNTGNSFFSGVYEVTRLVPKGRVTSYGAIARYLGSGRSALMVGWALNKSFSQTPFVPAHRVLNRNGLLTGKKHFGTPTAMQQLLENEGVIIENNKVVNFKEVFWDPSIELTDCNNTT